MRAFLFDRSSVMEYRLSLAVIRDCQKPDPAVDPDYVCDFFFLQFPYLIRNGNMQEELPVLSDQFRCSEPASFREVLFISLFAERDFDPSFQGVDREQTGLSA